jgi:glycosyltransferase involved in cell wall biosynthesis
MTALPHISVCICTYRRPEWLLRLLKSVEKQETGGRFTFSAVVADNDATESARLVVERYRDGGTMDVIYCVEPEKNIASVRNRAISAATGEWIAFIDDDEFAIEPWLLRLYEACLTYKAQGVLGPVRSHYEVTPPDWVPKCGLYDRKEFPTGHILPWPETRTGNVLFDRSILIAGQLPFDPQFPNGGEDQDFFRRMMANGHRFVWCNEAVVYETVPPIRWDLKVMKQRALLRGKNTLKHSRRNTYGILKSLIALIAYSLTLPLLAITARHLYVRYLIKLCDHAGKLLAALNLNSVSERLG